MEGVANVEDLERQIDSVLARKASPTKKSERSVALNDDNVRRVFGLTPWALFKVLAERFGYDIEDDSESP